MDLRARFEDIKDGGEAGAALQDTLKEALRDTKSILEKIAGQGISDFSKTVSSSISGWLLSLEIRLCFKFKTV